jgi:2-polyprenyl-6-methoxyphenol hydroxylase-like FAD-dependent oxidoreductase
MHSNTPSGQPIPVAIVGAGPTGLSLALGLARHGIRSVLLEKNPGVSCHSKAPGIHIRTREVFNQWGIEEAFLAAGLLREVIELHSSERGRSSLARIDLSELSGEADRPGILLLEQSETERLLLEAVRETGLCEVRFEAEAVGLEQLPDRVALSVRSPADDYVLEASYLAGCDGAGSFVRDATGLSFEGHTYSLRPLLADVRIEDGRDALEWPRTHNARGGMTTAIRLRPNFWRIIRLEDEAGKADEVPDEEVLARVGEVLGDGPTETVWSSRFRIHRRSAPRFRAGRVLLAGDAAHVHSPVGGQGMNGGIQDAHNLAWKLAGALRGGHADRLLNSYDVERRAVIVENVSRYTDLVTRTFLQTSAPVRAAVFLVFRSLLRLSPVRRLILRRATMIDLHYPPSGLLLSEDVAAGRRLPNPLLSRPDGSTVRLHSLLPVGPSMLDIAQNRPFMANLPVPFVIRIGPDAYQDRSGLLRRFLDGRDGLILVRPDLHIAWANPSPHDLEGSTARALGMSGPPAIPRP